MTEAPDIRATRKQLGMTQLQLANALGMTPGYIGLMELGKAPVTLRTALAVSLLVERKRGEG